MNETGEGPAQRAEKPVKDTRRLRQVADAILVVARLLQAAYEAHRWWDK